MPRLCYTKAMPNNWPKILKKNNGKWLVDTLRKLKPRQRRHFPSKKDAEAYAQKLNDDMEAYGRTRVLSPLQQSDALVAFDVLRKANLGETLTEACRFYASHRGISKDTVLKIWLGFKDEKETLRESKFGHLRDYYVDTLHIPFRNTLDVFGDRIMAEITQPELEKFFRELKLEDKVTPQKPYSKHVVYRYTRMLWNWAKTQKHISLNPFDDMKAPILNALTPRILTIQEAQKLIDVCHRSDREYFIPYVCLGLFCGVRTAELLKLKWSDIKPDWTVAITAEVAKKKRARNIPIPLNAQLMLEPLMDKVANTDLILQIPRRGMARKDQRKDGQTNFWRRWRELIDDAGLAPWDRNSIRHSYASYLYRITGEDSRLTIDRMGHSSVQVLFAHYVSQTPDRLISLGYWTIAARKDHKLHLNNAVNQFISPQKTLWQDILQTLNVARY